jgi:hypothetical protein
VNVYLFISNAGRSTKSSRNLFRGQQQSGAVWFRSGPCNDLAFHWPCVSLPRFAYFDSSQTGQRCLNLRFRQFQVTQHHRSTRLVLSLYYLCDRFDHFLPCLRIR